MNSINDVKSYYLDFVRSQTNRYEDSNIQKTVLEFSESILDFIINYKNINGLVEIEYGTIKEIVGSNNDKDIQYTLHLLSLEPYDVLEWVFYVESDDFYEPDRAYLSVVEMAEILKEKEYYNPLTGDAITQEEFSRIVITVFKVTSNFKIHLNKTAVCEVS